MSEERVLTSSRHAGLTTEQYEELRSLVAGKFGIDYPPQRRSVLASRLASRLEVHGIASFSEYCAYLRELRSDAAEWDDLAELLTNSETFFFREPTQFEHAASLLPSLSARAKPIRVLSAGCSSGEEAYSLAMVIASRTLLSKHFEVHGIDVTSTRLDKARAGRYPLRSLSRGASPPQGVRVEHFGAVRDGTWQLHAWLRNRVQFHHRNLVEPGDLNLGLFDLVFCRNVLIYAHPERVSTFVNHLCASLRPGGYLFLGSSESLMNTDAPLRPLRLGDHFIYVRSDGNPSSDRR